MGVLAVVSADPEFPHWFTPEAIVPRGSAPGFRSLCCTQYARVFKVRGGTRIREPLTPGAGEMLHCKLFYGSGQPSIDRGTRE